MLPVASVLPQPSSAPPRTSPPPTAHPDRIAVFILGPSSSTPFHISRSPTGIMSYIETISSFVEGAPPGELADVVADIKTLAAFAPDVVSELRPAFEKYNEEQLATVKLPGSSQPVRRSSPTSHDRTVMN
ncbi:hypothetical protein E4U53_000147 [Claviceps sorghi]|nr:hypothetical protein E4U53_000147 [Claviceps sorghi]